MGHDPDKADCLISSIYDAAVDGRLWKRAVLTLAKATDCAQASIDIFDRSSGLLVKAWNPLIDKEFIASYLAHWRDHFPHSRKTARFPVGQLIHRTDAMDLESVLKSDFYNEWMKPQGIGGD